MRLNKKLLLYIIATILVIMGIIYLLRNTLVGDIYGRTLGKLYEGPSSQTFTLSGELPTYFSLDIISDYQADRADECLRYSAKAGHHVSYTTWKKQTIAMSDEGHYNVNIPTSLYDQGCHLPTQSIKMTAYEHYDTDLKQTAMEQWAASLSFANSTQLADEAPHFETNKPMIYNSRCSNMLRIMGGDLLIKILGCYNAGTDWQWIKNNKPPKVYDVLRRDELANQQVIINLRHNLYDDGPYFDNSWLKTEHGLKPCLETKITRRCQKLPIFRNFIMNGKTCTIYPQCTDHHAMLRQSEY